MKVSVRGKVIKCMMPLDNYEGQGKVIASGKPKSNCESQCHGKGH